MFGVEALGLNMKGQAKVRTFVGSFLSLSVLTLTMLFALLKLQHLIERKNPTLTTHTGPIEVDEAIDLGKD